MSEATSIYPAPRWFREAVLEWLAATPADLLRHRTGDLFIRVVIAQPPQFRVVDGGMAQR